MAMSTQLVAPEPLYFHGVPIITSPALPFIRAKRSMMTKPWHGHRGTGGYAERVRKKWLKRFGTEEVNMLLTSGRYFVSASVASQLMNASLR